MSSAVSALAGIAKGPRTARRSTGCRSRIAGRFAPSAAGNVLSRATQPAVADRASYPMALAKLVGSPAVVAVRAGMTAIARSSRFVSSRFVSFRFVRICLAGHGGRERSPLVAMPCRYDAAAALSRRWANGFCLGRTEQRFRNTGSDAQVGRWLQAPSGDAATLGKANAISPGLRSPLSATAPPEALSARARASPRRGSPTASGRSDGGSSG